LKHMVGEFGPIIIQMEEELLLPLAYLSKAKSG
jgi:hypothetical protein